MRNYNKIYVLCESEFDCELKIEEITEGSNHNKSRPKREETPNGKVI